MASPPFHGGCQCRANRYTVSAPLEEITFCHCTACRHLSGAPYLPFVRCDLSSFTWTTAQQDGSQSAGTSTPSPTLKTLRLSSIATRTFCTSCGTPLTMHYFRDKISVTAGSFDEEHAQELKRLAQLSADEAKRTGGAEPCHIFITEQAPWAELDVLVKVAVYERFDPGFEESL